MNKIIDKINYLNKDCKNNWEIRFHGNYVDINYPDSPVTPDYEDYKSLDIVLDEVIKDLKTVNKTKIKAPIHDYSKKVDKIIADRGTVDEQLVKMLEMVGGKVIDCGQEGTQNVTSSRNLNH